jgi:hypothetical protein
MSGIPNQDVPFEPQPGFVAYRAPLADAGGSRWQVDVMGLPEVCDQFLREGGFRVELVPLDEKAQYAQPAARRRKTRASNKLTDEVPVQRGVQFGITIRLIESAISGPSVIKFEIDPVITGSSSPHGYWLYLDDDTDAPNIVCTPTRGSVVMSLYGAGNFWSAYVYWVAGDPAEYTLRGDIVRF